MGNAFLSKIVGHQWYLCLKCCFSGDVFSCNLAETGYLVFLNVSHVYVVLSFQVVFIVTLGLLEPLGWNLL